MVLPELFYANALQGSSLNVAFMKGTGPVEPAGSQRSPVSSPSICKQPGCRQPRLAGAVGTTLVLRGLDSWAVWAAEGLSVHPVVCLSPLSLAPFALSGCE